MPVRGEKRGTRLKPLSTTTPTPSTVILVSAIDVASTILRFPKGSGKIAASWAACERVPCSLATTVFSPIPIAPNLDSTQLISPTPGKNTSISP